MKKTKKPGKNSDDSREYASKPWYRYGNMNSDMIVLNRTIYRAEETMAETKTSIPFVIYEPAKMEFKSSKTT